MPSRRTWRRRRARSRPDASRRDDLPARLPRRRAGLLPASRRGERLRHALRGLRAAAGAAGPVPVLYYLAGLTCTEETFVTKAGALEHAARLGLMLVAPDTSPRVALPGDRDSLGLRHRGGLLPRRHAGAVVASLPHVQLRGRRAAAGHRRELSVPTSRAAASWATRWVGTARSPSRCKNPEKYRSVSAFAPIVRADRRCRGA